MTNAPYRHIIWDWNGTLFDDFWLWHEISNAQFKANGVEPISVEKHRSLWRHPVREFYREVGIDFTTTSYEKLCEVAHREYESRYRDCNLHDGAREAIAAAEQSRISQSILSALPQVHLDALVELHGLKEHFTEVLGLKDLEGNSKIESAKSHIKNIDVDLKEIVFIGDSTHDFEAASEIGVSCFLIPNGLESRNNLEKHGTPMFNSLSELPHVLYE